MEISQLLNFGPIFDDLDSLVHRAKELRTKLNPLKEGHLICGGYGMQVQVSDSVERPVKSQKPVFLACSSVSQQLSRDLLHSPDHGNVVGIEYAYALDMLSWNNEVVVLPGGPVVAKGHVFVVGEEELGIFALLSLAGNFAKYATIVDLGLGGAGIGHHAYVSHRSNCGTAEIESNILQ